jgi:AmiR/NasT family two-component response regulator
MDTRHEVFNNLQAMISMTECLQRMVPADNKEAQDMLQSMLNYIGKIEVTCNKYMSVKSENAALQQTLADRKLIEKAKGILMQGNGCDENNAFVTIRKTAMDRRTTMATIAKEIIESVPAT